MTKFYKDKQQIIDWIDKHEVKNYTLIPDEKYGFIVNVNGNVDLSHKELTNIPVKFGEITGSFECNVNQLSSLEFSPKTVGGDFWCSNNKLTSLKFSPKIVNDSFDCSYNKLTSLEFCPQTVESNFNCSNNQLTSLEFCIQALDGNFYCEKNPKLKKIQEITDFELIILEHKKALITKFSDKLENELTNYNSKKSARIKI